jgi:hypothetical protein
MVEMVL